MPTDDTSKYGERLVRLESRIDHMENDVGSIKQDVRQIRDALLQGKGSWKTAASLIGLAGAILVAVFSNWLIQMFGDNK